MDYTIDDFELENEIDIEDVELNNEYNIEDFGVDVAYGGGTIKQIYRGENLPTDPNILIWIDTSIPPITGTQLITADNLGFYTSDNEAFILQEPSSLITADNKNFITSDDKTFILNENTENTLLTLDNKEFIEANNKIFILKEEL